MKLIKKIDQLFDTFEKRITWIEMIVLSWWMWQYIWLLMMMIALFKVTDETSLLSFYETIQAYNVSLFARIAFSVMNYRSILTAFSMIDLLFVFVSLYMIGALKKKTMFIFGGITVALIAWIGLCMGLGLQSSTLAALFSLLHFLSMGGVLFCGWFIILGLFILVKLIFLI